MHGILLMPYLAYHSIKLEKLVNKIFFAVAASLAIVGCGQTDLPEKHSDTQVGPVAEAYGIKLLDQRIALISQQGTSLPYLYSTDTDGTTWFVSRDGTGPSLKGMVSPDTRTEQYTLLLQSS